jgi:hypothetical protein
LRRRFRYSPCRPLGQTGITEIRGPCYSAYGPRHLADLLEPVGAWIDGVKYAGGSFALMRPEAVRSTNKMAHDHNVYISTGGWIENVLRFGGGAVDRYIDEAKALGFDVIEISTGFINLPTEALLGLVKKVKKAGLKAKPELGISSVLAPDRATGDAAFWHLGHQKHGGPHLKSCSVNRLIASKTFGVEEATSPRPVGWRREIGIWYLIGRCGARVVPRVATSVLLNNSSERESINSLIGTDIKPIFGCNECLEMMQSCHHRPCAPVEKWLTIVASKSM